MIFQLKEPTSTVILLGQTVFKILTCSLFYEVTKINARRMAIVSVLPGAVLVFVRGYHELVVFFTRSYLGNLWFGVFCCKAELV